MNQKHFENGVLVKEIRDGILITENLGKTPIQISSEELKTRELLNGSQQPSILKKASNLAGAGVRVIKAVTHRQRISASTEEQQRRLSICEVCEFSKNGTCQKCGCFIRFKTKLETEHCPIHKW